MAIYPAPPIPLEYYTLPMRMPGQALIEEMHEKNLEGQREKKIVLLLAVFQITLLVISILGLHDSIGPTALASTATAMYIPQLVLSTTRFVGALLRKERGAAFDPGLEMVISIGYIAFNSFLVAEPILSPYNLGVANIVPACLFLASYIQGFRAD